MRIYIEVEIWDEDSYKDVLRRFANVGLSVRGISSVFYRYPDGSGGGSASNGRTTGISGTSGQTTLPGGPGGGGEVVFDYGKDNLSTEDGPGPNGGHWPA